MRVHYLQHVSFEGAAAIETWAYERGHSLSCTELFRDATDVEQTSALPALPSLEQFDFLVLMGGPMGVHDEAEYPWLRPEKNFIRSAIDGGKAVLGICLGAQLIADILGAKVSRNHTPEIGWYPVELTRAGCLEAVLADYPSAFTALQWHGDTFAIPHGATHLASSPACTNQAFAYDDGRVIGLQFHLEVTPESLRLLADVGGSNLPALRTEPWVATREGLLDPASPYAECQGLLFKLLDEMAARVA